MIDISFDDHSPGTSRLAKISRENLLLYALKAHAPIETIQKLIYLEPYSLFTGRMDSSLNSFLFEKIELLEAPSKVNAIYNRIYDSASSSVLTFSTGMIKKDRTELHNIKVIAARIVKVQKKQAIESRKQKEKLRVLVKALETREAKERKRYKRQIIELTLHFEKQLDDLGCIVTQIIEGSLEKQKNLVKTIDKKENETFVSHTGHDNWKHFSQELSNIKERQDEFSQLSTQPNMSSQHDEFPPFSFFPCEGSSFAMSDEEPLIENEIVNKRNRFPLRRISSIMCICRSFQKRRKTKNAAEDKDLHYERD
jgi:hypothetical protein